MNITKNIARLVNDPLVRSHYWKWLLAKSSSGPPVLKVGDVSLGGFAKFSNYLGAVVNQPDANEHAYIARSLSPSAVAIDVGANYGLMSTIFSRAVGDTGQVFAFEPIPQTYEALTANLQRNACTNVSTFNRGVGAEVGEATFSLKDDAATNRMQEDGDLVAQIDTIDALVSREEIAEVAFLKIDVEGAELLVIKGAQATLKANRVVSGLIEICPGNLAPFGNTVADIHREFDALGYGLFWLDRPDTRIQAAECEVLPSNFLGNAGFKPLARFS